MSVPERLIRNGRKPDPTFGSDELLYRRIPLEYLDGNEVLQAHLVAFLEFPATSTNRSKYSEPVDVLIEAKARPSAVFSWIVSEVVGIEVLREDLNGFDYTSYVEHVPEELNYSHSEIRTRRVNSGEDKKPSSKQKMEYRSLLASRARRVLI